MGTDVEPEGTTSAASFEASPFEVTTDTTGSTPTVRVSGELDLDTYALLQAAIRSIELTTTDDLLLDLRNVTFLDSTGLNMLLAEVARARSEGRRLLLVRPGGPADRIFQLTLLEDRFEFVEGPPDPA